MLVRYSRFFHFWSLGPLMAGLLAILPSVAWANDPSESRTLLSVRPSTVAAALGDMGYAVKIETVGEEAYRLDDTAGRFSVHLARCAAERCSLLQVRICRDIPGTTNAQTARWNTSQTYGRASIQTDGLVCIDNTYHAPDTLITFAALRAQVEGVLAVSEPAFSMIRER